MFSIEFKDFLNNPISFGFNTEADFLVLACFLLLGTFQTSNRSNLFATSFFQEIKVRERKRSTRNATRSKRRPTTWITFLAEWWGPSGALWVQSLPSSPLWNCVDLTPWGGLPCQRSISEFGFINSMLEYDAHVYAYQWHLMYLHALNLSFVLHHHHDTRFSFSYQKSLLLLCMLFYF
jgi:hypothetical protein